MYPDSADYREKLGALLPALDLAEKVKLISRFLDPVIFKSPVGLAEESEFDGRCTLIDIARSYRGYLKKPLKNFLEEKEGRYKLNRRGAEDLQPIAEHFESVSSLEEEKEGSLDFLCSLFYRTKYPDFLFDIMDWVYGNDGKEKEQMPRNGISERNLYYFIDKYSRLGLFEVKKDFVKKFSTHPFTEFKKTELGEHLYKNFFLPIKTHLSSPPDS